MYSVYSDWSSTSRVSPFGNPRIKACLQLPVAYRSLSRPSSPIHAKASSIRHKILKSSHFTWLELVPFWRSYVSIHCLQRMFFWSGTEMLSQKNILLQILFRFSTEMLSQKNILLFVSHIVSQVLESTRSSTALRNNHYVNEQELEDNAPTLASRLMSRTLVELHGLEPWTPCLQSRCSTNWAISPRFSKTWKLNT